MKQQPCAITALTLEAREQLPEAHLSGLWRVQTGAMRLNLHEPHDQNLIRMVLPGDLLGMEQRVGITDHLVVHTLIPTTLIPVHPQDDAPTSGYDDSCWRSPTRPLTRSTPRRPVFCLA